MNVAQEIMKTTCPLTSSNSFPICTLVKIKLAWPPGRVIFISYKVFGIYHSLVLLARNWKPQLLSIRQNFDAKMAEFHFFSHSLFRKILFRQLIGQEVLFLSGGAIFTFKSVELARLKHPMQLSHGKLLKLPVHQLSRISRCGPMRVTDGSRLLRELWNNLA